MVLHISTLTLSHFRSHKRAHLDADARPVAIFGPNGAGKTNILEAVSLFSPGRGLRRASADQMVRQPEALGWKLSGVLHAIDKTAEVETWSEGGASRQVRLDGKAAAQTALAKMVRMLWLVPSMDRLWIEGAEGRRRFLDRMTLSFEPGHAQAVLDYEKAMRERNRLLKDQVRDPHWYAALERQMGESGVALQANRLRAVAALSEAQAGAETAFPRADLAVVHPDVALPEAAEDLTRALSENRMRDLAAGRTLIGPHRVDLEGTYAAKGVSARQCSTGEQKALLISLVLANARALAAEVGYAPILLLDEVAAHLDPGRRAALYDEICGLNVQAWMTGTEIGLFEELGARAQYLEVRDEDQMSVVAAP